LFIDFEEQLQWLVAEINTSRENLIDLNIFDSLKRGIIGANTPETVKQSLELFLGNPLQLDII
jgi:hypothetical protein